MQRLVRLDNLRGMDPITLEVTITDVLRRPFAQIETGTLCDLLALAEWEGAPKGLTKALAGFQERIFFEIGDLPDGEVWTEFVSVLSALDAGQVPQSLRDHLAVAADAEGRNPASARALQPLQATWAEAPPEPFNLGDKGARVEKHRVMNRPEPLGNRKSIRVADDKPKRRRSTTGGAKRTATPKPPTMDTDKLDFLVQTCLEKLGRYSSNGLSEAVLVVGVRKQVEDDYPGTTGPDVMTALKHLEAIGKAKKSAGRWSVPLRWD